MVSWEHQFCFLVTELSKCRLAHLHVLECVYVRADPDHTFDFLRLGYNLAKNYVVCGNQRNKTASYIVFVNLSGILNVLKSAKTACNHIHRQIQTLVFSTINVTYTHIYFTGVSSHSCGT